MFYCDLTRNGCKKTFDDKLCQFQYAAWCSSQTTSMWFIVARFSWKPFRVAAQRFPAAQQNPNKPLRRKTLIKHLIKEGKIEVGHKLTHWNRPWLVGLCLMWCHQKVDLGGQILSWLSKKKVTSVHPYQLCLNLYLNFAHLQMKWDVW